MSVSSFEGSPLPSDLSTKYQKLATEYAKIRAQVTVLKKAVLDEQSHVAELKNVMKAKDQTLRKNEQEIESLNFRNQQLTKRIEVLQEEFHRSQQLGNKKNKTKPDAPDNIRNIRLLEEELEIKINENARLVTKLVEERAEREEELAQWNETLRAAARDQKNYQENNSVVQNNCQCALLAQKLKEMEEELKVSRQKANSVERRFKRQEVLLKFKIIDREPILRCWKKMIAACVCCQEQFPQEILRKHDGLLDQFGLALSTDCSSVLPSLRDFSICLEILVSHVQRSDVKRCLVSLKNIWQITENAFNFCLNGDGDMETALSELVESVRTFKGTLKYQLNLLKESWENASDSSKEGAILNAMEVLFEECTSYWKRLSHQMDLLNIKCDGGQENFMEKPIVAQLNGNDNQKICDCNELENKYKKQVKELEEKILTLSQESGKSPCCSENAAAIDIINETGSGLIKLENYPSDGGETKDLLLQKVDEAVADMQLAESKVTRLITENTTLKLRLEDTVELCRILKLEEARLQEKLTDTTKNYEDQLSSMSEHVACLNEKFIQKDDELDQLRYHLANAELKK